MAALRIIISARRFSEDQSQEKRQSTCEVGVLCKTSTADELHRAIRTEFNVPEHFNINTTRYVHGAALTGETMGEMGIKDGEKLFAVFSTKPRSLNRKSSRRAVAAGAGNMHRAELTGNTVGKMGIMDGEKLFTKSITNPRSGSKSSRRAIAAGAGDILPQKKRAIDTSSSQVKCKCDIICLEYLPESTLVEISAYLPKSARALLAVAMTAPSSKFSKYTDTNQIQLSPSSKAIIAAEREALSSEAISAAEREANLVFASVQTQCSLKKTWGYSLEGADKRLKESYKHGWKVVDFLDLSFGLVSRLTDDDLLALLMCIGPSNVRTLRLTNCISIFGWGLGPLRESSDLELLDLRSQTMMFAHSFVLLNVDVVLPIIEENYAFRYGTGKVLRILVPEAWMKASEGVKHLPDIPLQTFLDQHTEHALRYIRSPGHFCPSSINLYIGFNCRDEFASTFGTTSSDPLEEKCCGAQTYVFCNTCNQMVCGRSDDGTHRILLSQQRCGNVLECEGICDGWTCHRCRNAPLESIGTDLYETCVRQRNNNHRYCGRDDCCGMSVHNANNQADV